MLSLSNLFRYFYVNWFLGDIHVIGSFQLNIGGIVSTIENLKIGEEFEEIIEITNIVKPVSLPVLNVKKTETGIEIKINGLYLDETKRTTVKTLKEARIFIGSALVNYFKIILEKKLAKENN